MLRSVGGKIPVDASCPKHMDMAWKATKTVNKKLNSAQNHMMPIKVLTATDQEVAGSLYDYKVLFGESNFDKETVAAADLNKDNCSLKENGSRAIYKVRVWERLWLNFLQIKVKKVRDVEAHEEF